MIALLLTLAAHAAPMPTVYEYGYHGYTETVPDYETVTDFDGENLICPICKRLNKRSTVEHDGMCGRTLLECKGKPAYWDGDGHRHSATAERCNTETCMYLCSNGHRFKTVLKTY
jgi:hypothetical protein